MSDVLDLTAALKALHEAQEWYAEADREYQSARRVQTSALNKLNEAQKAFDAAVIEERKSPPWDSEWARKNKAAGQVAE